LALIPAEYVIRAFYIIAELASIPELAEFIYFFKRTYIGLTDYEFKMKALAFGPNFEDNLMQVEQTVAYEGFYSIFFFLFSCFFPYQRMEMLAMLNMFMHLNLIIKRISLRILQLL